MAALFAGVTNCPITSLVIALELFGYEGMEYFSIIIAVAFAVGLLWPVCQPEVCLFQNKDRIYQPQIQRIG